MRSRRAVLDEPGDTPEFQVSAMVDILMTLLIFFVATATFEAVRQPADLSLPVVAGVPVRDAHRPGLVVQIEKNTGRILIDQESLEQARALVPLIRERIRLSRKLRGPDSDFQVVIRADRNTPYRRVEEVMRAAGEAGVVDVLFALERTPAGTPNGGGRP